MESVQKPPVPPKASIQLLKSLAINSAMFELLQENKLELMKRARIKLKEMGVEFSDDEFAKEMTPPEQPAKP